PLTTADLPRRQPRGSSLHRLCRRHHTAAEQIEMRAAGHDACRSRHLELDRDLVRRPHTVAPGRSSQPTLGC
uniref:Uncharacterized protein n=1 Tax=Aegilops tauschii subsp. strangulata TaxID=200361 RepID=A0A453GS39_AEGTS